MRLHISVSYVVILRPFKYIKQSDYNYIGLCGQIDISVFVGLQCTTIEMF